MAKIKENKWTDTTDRIDFPVNTVSNNAQLARSDGSKGAITGTGGGSGPFQNLDWTHTFCMVLLGQYSCYWGVN